MQFEFATAERIVFGPRVVQELEGGPLETADAHAQLDDTHSGQQVSGDGDAADDASAGASANAAGANATPSPPGMHAQQGTEGHGFSCTLHGHDYTVATPPKPYTITENTAVWKRYEYFPRSA